MTLHSKLQLSPIVKEEEPIPLVEVQEGEEAVIIAAAIVVEAEEAATIIVAILEGAREGDDSITLCLSKLTST